ncbi:MAG: DEAD/DEAH box helicase [Coriobacteriales bacterium]|nr:DEAD/DEAH box helicase [Coriobacteriales bacterium]
MLFLKSQNVAIIIDESAKIKNPETKVAQALFELSELFKIKTIMTGTPIANRPFDIWAQIYFLDKGLSLGTSFDEFKTATNLSNDLANDKIKQDLFAKKVSEIFQKIKSFSVRETKTGRHTISLPSKNITDVKVEFENVQQVMYEQVRKDMYIVVQQGDTSIFDDSSTSLKRMTRLIEIASNPKIIDDSYNRNSGKEVVLQNLLEEIMGRDEKCIVWSSFIKNIEIFTQRYACFNSVKIHGKMDINRRNKSVENFQNGEAQILFATPQAAKEGLTLTAANNAIFYDRSFNLDDYLQAQDRIHRISQKKDCNIYNLVMDDSIDLWIAKLLSAKKAAASLGQGDIKLNTYKKIADYSFGDMVKDVLGCKENKDD